MAHPLLLLFMNKFKRHKLKHHEYIQCTRVPIVILKGERDYASLPSLYILQKEDKSLFPSIGRLGTIPFSCTHLRNLICKELQAYTSESL